MGKRPNMRHQCDYNAGISGGVLLSVIQEPFGMEGNWELFKSERVEEPDGVYSSTPWIPRSLGLGGEYA